MLNSNDGTPATHSRGLLNAVCNMNVRRQCFLTSLSYGTARSKLKCHGRLGKIFKGYTIECYEIKQRMLNIIVSNKVNIHLRK